MEKQKKRKKEEKTISSTLSTFMSESLCLMQVTPVSERCQFQPLDTCYASLGETISGGSLQKHPSSPGFRPTLQDLSSGKSLTTP